LNRADQWTVCLSVHWSAALRCDTSSGHADSEQKNKKAMYKQSGARFEMLTLAQLIVDCLC
jgi:hypothetical protein